MIAGTQPLGLARGRLAHGDREKTTTAARKLHAMTPDYDTAIAKVAQNIEGLRPQMQDALGAWLDATAPWVAERWRETLEAAVAYNPDAVKELGDERRKALKDRTTAMVESPRPHVEKRLVEDHPEAWPHLRDIAAPGDANESFITKTERVGNRSSQTVPSGVSAMLGSVLSDMADLLEHEGFNLAKLLPGSPLSRSQKPRVAEGTSLAWSAEMMQTMNAYGQLTLSYFRVLAERDEIQAQKDRSEAEELWSNA